MQIGSHTLGVSSEARAITWAAIKVRQRLHHSKALGFETMLEELGTVWEECRFPNWDGYDALPVQQETLRNAYLFIESLPLGFPSPSIGAEPDGDLTFEWHHSRRRTLSISVSSAGELHFAALLGPSRRYGTEAFFGEVPEHMLKLALKVLA